MFRYSDYDATPFEPSLPSPDCTLIAPLLTAYFDLEARGAEAARVQQHLSGCARCAQMWRDWGDARLLLQTTPTPAPPYTLAAEIVQTSRLMALLPAAPLTSAFGLANRQNKTAVPLQLQDAILAVTTRAPVTMTDVTDTLMNDAVVMPRDFYRPLRKARPLIAMALVPTLALWLITLTANNTTFFASSPSQTSAPVASETSSVPAMSRVSSFADADLMIALPQNATAQPHGALPQKPVLPRVAEATETMLAPASSAADDVVAPGSEPSANRVALAQWSQPRTAVPGTLATPLSAYSVQPIATSPLPSAVPLRVTTLKAIKTAFTPQKNRVARVAALPQTPRRSAKLSTVSMTTPAALASSMSVRAAKMDDETPRGDAVRMAMKLDAPSTQKAMLPVASSRETTEESLWQSDVTTGGSALAVVQALNDNRPRELRDAFDAYAKTLIDDSDVTAATL